MYCSLVLYLFANHLVSVYSLFFRCCRICWAFDWFVSGCWLLFLGWFGFVVLVFSSVFVRLGS